LTIITDAQFQEEMNFSENMLQPD